MAVAPEGRSSGNISSNCAADSARTARDRAGDLSGYVGSRLAQGAAGDRAEQGDQDAEDDGGGVGEQLQADVFGQFGGRLGDQRGRLGRSGGRGGLRHASVGGCRSSRRGRVGLGRPSPRQPAVVRRLWMPSGTSPHSPTHRPRYPGPSSPDAPWPAATEALTVTGSDGDSSGGPCRYWEFSPVPAEADS